jgi:hypothetical protein
LRLVAAVAVTVAVNSAQAVRRGRSQMRAWKPRSLKATESTSTAWPGDFVPCR